MKERKLVLRTCVVSRETLEKKDLFRIVRTPEETVVVDLKGKTNGRGAYLKKDKEVILLAKKNKALDKKLEIAVPSEIYDYLIKLIDEKAE